MPTRLRLSNNECQVKVRVDAPVLTERPVKAGTVSLTPRGKLEPGHRQCPSCARAACRCAPPRRAERGPELGPAPRYLCAPVSAHLCCGLRAQIHLRGCLCKHARALRVLTEPQCAGGGAGLRLGTAPL
ncbi:hypothetical protein NDU88_003776 [Pleurodeles waltl]|uniref:Uncharacterized protein n=1 Tax=Pleurodeles waltl TaxID=8319 RepID=A0AAV7UD31_PLEWA|nr:hypothetical protein NDU88_003776 [Pleurodeles waltl]